SAPGAQRAALWLLKHGRLARDQAVRAHDGALKPGVPDLLRRNLLGDGARLRAWLSRSRLNRRALEVATGEGTVEGPLRRERAWQRGDSAIGAARARARPQLRRIAQQEASWARGSGDRGAPPHLPHYCGAG